MVGLMKSPLRASIWLSILALLVLVVFAVLESRLAPYDPLAVQFMPLDPPGWQNLFGTDDLGRDVFSRFVTGARISFVVGLVSVFFALLLGTVMGLAAAYFKPIQALVMRIVDAIWAFPMILLALALSASMKPGIVTVIVAIAVVYSPLFARLVYGQALSILERDFIMAAKAFGCKPARLLFTHVLPNLAAPLIVQATLTVGTAIVLESSLSFLGVGIQPPTPSWGVMIQTGYKWLEKAPWLSVMPGVGIYVTTVAFSVLGDWLRLILDPKQLSKGA
ncbi:MAG: ABC transporter permease [Deltaproteobacteria bacterium]|nr:ABC transporter permease [Deltaproteobacteria bacterium]